MALFIESDFFQEWDPIRKSRPIRKYFVRISNHYGEEAALKALGL